MDEERGKRLNYTPQQAKQKIAHYCSYQERCHLEVRQKLYSYGLNTEEVDDVVIFLISENFLNEERFAVQYAGGKFRMNKWGKNKIKQALRFKQISDYCINKALGQIDEGQYMKTFEDIVEKKLISLKREKNIFVKKRKLQDYLLQRGFESDLIREAIKNV